MSSEAPGTIAERIRAALESSDLVAFGELLDPEAQWGPPDDSISGCHNRDEIIAWYARSRDAGMRATVTEVVAGPGTVLVGVRVSGRAGTGDDGGDGERWQVLTLRGDRVVDIRGFDDRDEAAVRAGVSP